MTADTVGGVWTYCVELAHALAPHGVEVQLATMGRPLTAGQRTEAGVFAAVHQSSFPLEWMNDPWAGVDEAGAWLLALEGQVQPDVVHLNGYVHAGLAWHTAPLVVGHSDVLSWWHWVKGAAAPDGWQQYAGRVTAGLRAAGRVVVPTAAVAADLAREYGLADAVVVPNCREIAVPTAAKEALVLAAGRVWDEAKNLAALARIAPDLPSPVAVAGEGRLAGVQQLGSLPFGELVRWLARAKVFAAPARYEPFGLGILEAALAGCVLVLGNLPSLQEVWGDAATYVDDDDQLARALAEGLQDDGSRGQAARRRALTYSRERTAAGYLAQYAELTGASR